MGALPAGRLSAAAAALLGAAAAPGEDWGPLPNYDCWGDDALPHDAWADFYDLANTLADFNNAGDPNPSASSLRAIGERHLENLLNYDRKSPGEKVLLDICPYSFAPLRLSQWVACRFASIPLVPEDPVQVPPRCAEVRLSLSEVFALPATLPTVLNSRWMRPFCGVAELARPWLRRPEVLRQLDPTGVVNYAYNCHHLPEGSAESGVDWHRYRRAFTDGDSSAMALVPDWITRTIRFAFAPKMLQNIPKKVSECVLGTLSLLLEKLYLAQSARTEDYEKLAVGFLQILADFEERIPEVSGQPIDGLSVLMVTMWPVVPLLCVTSRLAQADTPSGKHGYQYKPFALDFFVREIIHTPETRLPLLEVRSLPCEEHLQLLEAKGQEGSTSNYRALIIALASAMRRCDMVAWGSSDGAVAKLVIMTMLWGARLASYLPGVLRRAQAFGLRGRYLVFCLDEAALEACREAHEFPEMCVPGQLQTIYNKYTMLSALVQLGFDVLYLDFDTLLLADPLPHLWKESSEHEVLVSRDLGGECLNTGVIYVKAHPDTAEMLTSLLVWLWHHPYEFSQKAFSAFLGLEKVADDRFLPLELKVIPRWTVLEPLNAFVTSAVYNLGVEGWTGSLERIVIFHFLDGTGGVDPERAIEGQYLNLYDLFYNNPRIDLANASLPLWSQDYRIRDALLRSRVPEAPTPLLPCILIEATK